MDIADKKYSSNEFNELIISIQLDMLAVFKNIEEDVIKLISQGRKEGWTVDELILKIEDLF